MTRSPLSCFHSTLLLLAHPPSPSGTPFQKWNCRTSPLPPWLCLIHTLLSCRSWRRPRFSRDVCFIKQTAPGSRAAQLPHPSPQLARTLASLLLKGLPETGPHIPAERQGCRRLSGWCEGEEKAARSPPIKGGNKGQLSCGFTTGN